jgi:hypothetical protein
MSDRDFDFETRPGIPAPLPAGEEILWQGSPNTAALAREAYKIRWITGYLVVIAVWRAGAAWADGGAGIALATLIPYLVLAAAGWAVIRALAWAQARASIYTITSARAILRIGAALPVTYTVPFTCVETASVAVSATDGTGTLALQTKGNMRLSWAVLWPHVRPGFLRLPQPAFRCIPDAARVARILADAAQARLNEPQISLAVPGEPVPAAATVAAE